MSAVLTQSNGGWILEIGTKSLFLRFAVSDSDLTTAQRVAAPVFDQGGEITFPSLLYKIKRYTEWLFRIPLALRRAQG